MARTGSLVKMARAKGRAGCSSVNLPRKRTAWRSSWINWSATCSAPRFGLRARRVLLAVLLLRAPHVVQRLIQLVESLLQLLLALLTPHLPVLLIAGLLPLAALLAHLPVQTGLAGLPRLPGLALLPLLTLLALLALLPLLVARQLFHLFFQLFGLAAQHFLLPALFEALLLALILLLGE